MIDPGALHIPLEIGTPRLTLRCPMAADSQLVMASVVESLAELRRWGGSLPWALEEPALAVSRFCDGAESKFLARTDFAYIVRTKEGEHVGNCGVHDIDWKVPKCEIGWWSRPALQGRGLMTEAASALLAFCFDTLGMRRVCALPEAMNARSCALCERIGMQLEGTLRNARVAPGGELRDVRVYAAIR
jgi:RimJ/RimL family protein N-acetyltransferase